MPAVHPNNTRRLRVSARNPEWRALAAGGGPTLKGVSNVRDHASNAGGRRPFRPPDPLLEPQDGPYIFGARNKIHIVNLEQTLTSTTTRHGLRQEAVFQSGANILFVGTKRQAREIVAEEAQRAGVPMSISAGWAAC